MRQVLQALAGVPRLVARLLYGTGLRLQECLELCVTDLDFERREITVRRGEGQKDRRVMLPDAVRAPLEQHLEGVRRQHLVDLAAGLGRVVLPGALERKYPRAAIEWLWQFVFPAGRICRDQRFGPPSQLRRNPDGSIRTRAAGQVSIPEVNISACSRQRPEHSRAAVAEAVRYAGKDESGA